MNNAPVYQEFNFNPGVKSTFLLSGREEKTISLRGKKLALATIARSKMTFFLFIFLFSMTGRTLLTGYTQIDPNFS